MDTVATTVKSSSTGPSDLEKTGTHESQLNGEVSSVKNQMVNDYHQGIDTRGITTGTDEVYERKAAIMNQALIDIGMGSFQWKIFLMTGFGWFVDNVRTPFLALDRHQLDAQLLIFLPNTSFGCKLSPLSARL